MSAMDLETMGETVDFSLTVTGKIDRGNIPQFIESLGLAAQDVNVTFTANNIEAEDLEREDLISKNHLFEYCDEARISRVIAGRTWSSIQKTAFEGELLYKPPDASYWANIDHVGRNSLAELLDSGFDPTAITNVGQKSVDVMLGFLGMSPAAQ